jgi:hypothetical protein
MRTLLVLLFVGILVVMTIVTVRASLDRPVWDNGPLLKDPWFVATLCDAYGGFLTFFIWVAWRERTLAARVGWFTAIMLLGNFAMATYVLIQLARLPHHQPLGRLLERSPTK